MADWILSDSARSNDRNRKIRCSATIGVPQVRGFSASAIAARRIAASSAKQTLERVATNDRSADLVAVKISRQIIVTQIMCNAM